MLRCRVLTNSIHTIDFAVKDRHSAVHFKYYSLDIYETETVPDNPPQKGQHLMLTHESEYSST